MTKRSAGAAQGAGPPHRADEEESAGSFGVWLDGMLDVLGRGTAAAVPCGSCTACCTSSQFVHIAPDEAETLARIPVELRFPAPRLPRGHVLVGYDERGHCPMFRGGGCSIYEHRPRACRTYDCRVFPAAAVEPDDAQPAVAAQVRRWRFDHPSTGDAERHRAVEDAARFLVEHRSALPEPVRPATAAQVAVAAVEVHGSFLGRGRRAGPPAPSEVAVMLAGDRSRRGRSPGPGGD